MSCLDAEKLISARLDRDLSPGEAADLEAHLAACPACRSAAGEYARMCAGLEAAFRAEPLRSGPPARSAAPRPRAIPLAVRLAAAALLVAGGALGIYAAARRGAQPPDPDGGPAVVRLASGTLVIRKTRAEMQLLGSRENVDEVIHLEGGEIEILAAKAAPGRRAVRVVTPLGEVETLGTVFTVRLVRKAEGGREMRAGKLVTWAAAAMLVAVSDGQVLVRGELGEAVVMAGENAELTGGKLTAGKTERIIRARVTKVGKEGVTISAGKADGLKKGFEVTCKAKGWTAKVASAAEQSAVLSVTGKAAVGDVVETRLTTVLTEVPKGKPSVVEVEPKLVKADPIKAGPRVGGLELKLIRKETTHKYAYYVTKDGRPVRAGQGTRIPKDAEKKEREFKRTTLVAQIKNVGEAAVLLPQMYSGYYRSGDQTLNLFARDAEGKAVPRREYGARAMPAGGEKDEPKPVTVTILKPGQTFERVIYGTYALNFPEEGTYTLWAEFEVKPAEEEVLPGVKLWSGKLKSNELEHEHKQRAAWGRKKGAPAVPKNPAPDKEVF